MANRKTSDKAFCRKLHEKGLLTKLSDIEDKLAAYLSGLNKAIEETREGQSVKAPSLDTSALRREMEAIAADKHKLSMEGLLKIEDKMQRIESGLNRDKRELEGKVGVMASSTATSDLKKQLSKLDQLQEDLEKSHEQIRDKVERQIPQDLNELSQKLDNFKKQLHDRIDKEEEERFLAVKELQEAINKIKNRPVQVAAGAVPSSTEPTSSQVQRDVDECKIAIKKLAESVTTVKNVLDRKLNEEIRNREKAAARIENIVDAFKSKKNN